LELAEIASAPYQRNQINVPDYNGLPSIRQKLIDMICDSTCLTTSWDGVRLSCRPETEAGSELRSPYDKIPPWIRMSLSCVRVFVRVYLFLWSFTYITIVSALV